MSDAQQIAERLAKAVDDLQHPCDRLQGWSVAPPDKIADALLDAGLREAVELLEEMKDRMICRGYCADDSASALAALKGEKGGTITNPKEATDA